MSHTVVWGKVFQGPEVAKFLGQECACLDGVVAGTE